MTIRISGLHDVVYLARLRATAATDGAVGVPLAARMESVLELAREGEAGVAFENLCSNLHEYKVRLESTEFGAIARLGTELGIDPGRWESLSVLVADGPPPGYREPMVVWAVEARVYSDQSTYQLGVFTSEAEAKRLLAIRSPVDWGEVYLNMLPVHETVADWEYDA